MVVHSVVTGVGGVTGLFAGIQQRHKVIGCGGGHCVGHQLGGDVLLAHIGHIQGHLVSHKAQQGTVQFLVEGRVQVLVQEVLGLGQLLERLTGGLAVARTGHIGPTGSHLAEAQPEAEAGEQHHQQGGPPALGIHQEAFPVAQRGLGADEVDVLVQVFHALAVHYQRRAVVHGCGGRSRTRHFQRQGGRCGHIVLAAVHIVVAIFHGADGKVTGAARNKGELEGLGTRSAALVGIDGRFDVVHLEVRRELDLGRIQQGDVALAGDRDQQGCGVVRLERILAQACIHAEFTHATAKGRRGAGGQGLHVQGGRLGAPALPDGGILGAEEIVEDGARSGAAALLVHQAHDLGRLDGLVTVLLGNEHPPAQHGAVVHRSVHLLPLELNVGRGIHLLAPETVEGREAGVLEAHQVGPVVDFEGGGDGLSQHHGIAAEGEPHKDVGFSGSGR